jgi:hypothetical protein
MSLGYTLCLLSQVTDTCLFHKKWKRCLDNTHQKTVELLQFQDKGGASPYPGLGWLLGMAAGDLPIQKPESANNI